MTLPNSTQLLLRQAIRLTVSIEAKHPIPTRPFHASVPVLKKRKIAAASNSPPRAQASSSPSPSPSSSSSSSPNPEAPLDFSSLVASLAPHDTHYKSALQTILHGGRFNPSTLGALCITVKPASGEPSTFPLRELAQVVPRSSRTVSLLVNDRAYIKPIMSAVQSSREFNQQPQRSDDNDLELLLRVEPERKDELARRIRETTHAWRDRVRQARTRHDKVLKAWQKDGTVLKDVVRRAERELQKLQDGKMREIDGEESAAVKALDRN